MTAKENYIVYGVGTGRFPRPREICGQLQWQLNVGKLSEGRKGQGQCQAMRGPNGCGLSSQGVDAPSVEGREVTGKGLDCRGAGGVAGVCAKKSWKR